MMIKILRLQYAIKVGVAGLTAGGVVVHMSPALAEHRPSTANLPAQLASAPQADENQPATDQPAAEVEPRAAQILRAAGDTLAQAHSFRVKAEVQDGRVDRSGAPKPPRTVEVQIRRPDRMNTQVRSEAINRDIYYDGQTLTLYNRNRNLYGTAAVPGTLDETIDYVEERLGVTVPLGDMMVSDPYDSVMANVQTGRYAGQEQMLGVITHHLAFTQESIDWDIWIEDGPRPLIRKLVITYKHEPKAPQYIAILRDWELNPALADRVFIFQPPQGAQKIDVERNE